MFSNAKQHIPKVFHQIAENQAERERLRSASVVSLEDASRFKELKDDMDKSLRPGAERLLRWNKDKGDASGR